jgi:hypothetical protein
VKEQNYKIDIIIISLYNGIGGIMVRSGFEPPSGQTKDYKIGIYCFSAKHTALRRKTEDWLAPNQHNVSGWGHMCPRTVFAVN